MERINYNSFKFLKFLDSLNPKNSGILFSILFHLAILLFAVGLPNFFAPKDVFVPNIVPIEILNVSETTNFKKNKIDNTTNANTSSKQKKFNSSENVDIQKKIETKINKSISIEENEVTINIKKQENKNFEEKKLKKIEEKNNFQPEQKVETIKTNKIKPKIKPKPNKQETSINSDLQIDKKQKVDKKPLINDTVKEPHTKPNQDFDQMLASSLKDLRNKESNNVIENQDSKDDIKQNGKEEKNENMTLSISEIDLLRQQLSSCWNAPAGAVINIGDKVTVSAKVQQNMRVFNDSVRIVDTNISKNNPFYGPITDSAMRTLLNPECTPLKLPKDKYNLWKNLTITFDYSIMKGY